MFRRLAIVSVLPLLLAGCLMNGAREEHAANLRLDKTRATIIVGFADDRLSEFSGRIAITLDQFSMETGNITGNCFTHHRLKVERDLQAGETHYVVFSAPPGHYVISPFMARPISESAQKAFLAPAGVVTYFGDFREEGGEAPYWSGAISRTENLSAATGLARSRSLSDPVPAAMIPIQSNGHIFVCTP